MTKIEFYFTRAIIPVIIYQIAVISFIININLTTSVLDNIMAFLVMGVCPIIFGISYAFSLFKK